MALSAQQATQDGRTDSRRRETPFLYPIALKLKGQRCLVVGGGTVALRKTRDLLDCEALVHVVSPQWHEGFASLGGRETLTLSTRRFEPRDLDGARLVLAATDEPEVQETVARGAAARGIPCDVVDVNRLSSFYLPAVLRRGAFTIAVTTSGEYPLLAVAIRDRLAAEFGPQLGPALERLGETREWAFAHGPADPALRVAALRRLLTDDALDLILEGRLAEFEAHVESWKLTLSDRI